MAKPNVNIAQSRQVKNIITSMSDADLRQALVAEIEYTDMLFNMLVNFSELLTATTRKTVKKDMAKKKKR
jgi:hypothetical protein